MEEDNLIEKYQYKGEGDLIIDRPDTPLKLNEEKHKEEKKIDRKKRKPQVIEKQETVENNIKVEQKNLSNRELFNNLILDGNSFILKYKGNIIFDLDRDKLKDLDFQENGFYFYGVIYSYDGLSFKFKK
jgi:hypothetical protein